MGFNEIVHKMKIGQKQLELFHEFVFEKFYGDWKIEAFIIGLDKTEWINIEIENIVTHIPITYTNAGMGCLWRKRDGF